MVQKISDSPELWMIRTDIDFTPLKTINSYVLRDHGQTLVIDTGFNIPSCKKSLLSGLKEIGIALNADTSLFLTHNHIDHMGLAGLFAKAGCPIYMSRIDYEYYLKTSSGVIYPELEEIYHQNGFPKSEIISQFYWSRNPIFIPRRTIDMIPLDEGSLLQVGDLQARTILTPGHSPGHMMLYLPQYGILFTGDHILFDITPQIAVWFGEDNILGDYLDSLRKTRDIGPRLVLPAHRSNFNKTLEQRVDEILLHHEIRLQEIESIVREAPGISAYEIAQKTTWSTREMVWERFPPHQKWFAMGEVLSHLQYSLHEGRLTHSFENGCYRNYEPSH